MRSQRRVDNFNAVDEHSWPAPAPPFIAVLPLQDGYGSSSSKVWSGYADKSSSNAYVMVARDDSVNLLVVKAIERYVDQLVPVDASRRLRHCLDRVQRWIASRWKLSEFSLRKPSRLPILASPLCDIYVARRTAVGS